MPYSPIGQSKYELDTPALMIDLNLLERNIAEMAGRCKAAGVDWRPHTKGHKTPAIAHKAIEAGAIGVTCAKLGEAEVMVAGGIKDILVANQVVGESKVNRLVNLRRHGDVMVAIDDQAHIDAISKAATKIGVNVRVMIEVNVGMDRCGVEPGEETADLAEAAEAAPGVTYAGIMGYEGHAMHLPDKEKEAECIRCAGLLLKTVAALKSRGLHADIVSAGGTGTLAFTPALDGITEIQAGGGAMMDTFYRHGLHVKTLDQALRMLVTVVSHRGADRAVMDAGRKTFGGPQMPEVVGRPDITVEGLSAEHGKFALDGSGDAIQVGHKLELVSGYSDMTVFLHNQMYGIRNDRVETVWDIQGRGKLQ